jgi:hypothetical protein
VGGDSGPVVVGGFRPSENNKKAFFEFRPVGWGGGIPAQWWLGDSGPVQKIKDYLKGFLNSHVGIPTQWGIPAQWWLGDSGPVKTIKRLFLNSGQVGGVGGFRPSDGRR